MSTDELRTAAIEAARRELHDWICDSYCCGEACFQVVSVAIIDAVLPLLVAGTASRIADAIEAESLTVPGRTSGRSPYATGAVHAYDNAAAIARRVGETS
jgi:hypothetical protein